MEDDLNYNDHNETWISTTTTNTDTQAEMPIMLPPPMGSEEFFRLMNLSETMTRIITPLAVILGLILNVLLIYTSRTTRLKTAVFSIILICVGSANIGYLMIYFLSWLESLKFQVITNPGVCQIFQYLSNVFNFLPNWYLLGVLAERCRALCIIYLYKPPTCKFRVRLYMFIITCLPFFIYIVSLWATEVVEPLPGFKICSAKKRYGIMYRSFLTADPWLTVAGPMLGIILLLPFDFLFFLIQRHRTRHIRQGRDRNHSVAVAYRDEKWYTISVLIVVAVSLGLTTPKDFILVKNLLSEPSETERAMINMFTAISHLVRVVQPFLFLLVNKALRRRLRDICLRRKSCNRSP